MAVTTQRIMPFQQYGLDPAYVWGKNLIKNSPGQIVTDGAEPQWWDESSANCTLTDEDTAGEGIVDIHERCFKCVTIADDEYGYQTFTLADEELLDAGVTVVSLGCWVYCGSADKASIGIYGANLGLEESDQAGAGAWQWLAIEGITLNAADASIQVRLIVDTDTAYFTMPQLNIGSRALPWRPRGTKYAQLGQTTQFDLNPTSDVAWSDTDCTANTDPLAAGIEGAIDVREPNGTGGSYHMINSAFGSDTYPYIAQVLVLGTAWSTYASYHLTCSDSQVLRYSVVEHDNDNDVRARCFITGYWMWE